MTNHPPEDSLHHTLAFFSSDEEKCRRMAESAADGLAASEAVVVAADPLEWESITALLGPKADAVEFAEADLRLRTPVAAMEGIETLLAGTDAGTRLRLVGSARLTEETFPEWLRYEAALNEILADTRLTGVCFYDTRGPAAGYREWLDRTHAYLGSTPPGAPSRSYTAPRSIIDDLPVRRLHPRRPPDLAFTVTSEVRPVRSVAIDLAPSDRVEEVAMVVHELTALAVLGGPGEPEVRFWQEGDALVVQVAGSYAFDDPFAGLRFPGRDGQTALWVAGQLADDLMVDRSLPVPSVTVAFYH